MVQHTLEATKAFIFDVRPMVLDDLGLVPTLRRVARDRGRRSQVPIEFESYGQDRRLPMDIESALFRIIDEAVTGYLSCHPILISIKFEWGDNRIEARVAAKGAAAEEGVEEEDAEGLRAGAEGEPPGMDVPVGAAGHDRREARPGRGRPPVEREGSGDAGRHVARDPAAGRHDRRAGRVGRRRPRGRPGACRRVSRAAPGRRAPGQGLVEYGLILFLAAVVCLVSLLFFGDQLSALLTLHRGARSSARPARSRVTIAQDPRRRPVP